jgi:hypothetical protein
MTMAKSETIKIQIGEEVIELSGADKEAFLADREARAQETLLLEAEQAEKKQLRESAIRQLAQTANLSEEQIETLLGGI